jgi:WD40 repeat protein
VIWEARSGKRKVAITGRVEGICSIRFSPDGKLLAIAEFPGIIRLWDVPGGRERLTIKAPAWTPGVIAFSPDGRRLAAGLWTASVNGVSPPGNGIMIWHVATGKPVLRLNGHNDAVEAVAFSLNGKLLASGGGDPVVNVGTSPGPVRGRCWKFPGS